MSLIMFCSRRRHRLHGRLRIEGREDIGELPPRTEAAITTSGESVLT